MEFSSDSIKFIGSNPSSVIVLTNMDYNKGKAGNGNPTVADSIKMTPREYRKYVQDNEVHIHFKRLNLVISVMATRYIFFCFPEVIAPTLARQGVAVLKNGGMEILASWRANRKYLQGGIFVDGILIGNIHDTFSGRESIWCGAWEVELSGCHFRVVF